MKARRLLTHALGLALLSCGADQNPTSSMSMPQAGSAGMAGMTTAGAPGGGAGGNATGGGSAQAGGGAGGNATGGSAGQGVSGGGAGGSGGDAMGGAAGSGGSGGVPPLQYCMQTGDKTPTFTQVAAVDQKINGAVGLVGNPEEPDTNYVLEHFTGNVRIVKAGKLLPDNLLHVDVRQDPPGKEQGLLSIALSPKFTENHLLYVQYSALNPVGQSRIDEFKLSDATHATFVRRVYDMAHSHQWHNGGTLNFGKDNWLYFSIGDNQADCGPTCAQMAEGPYGRIRKLDVSAQDVQSTVVTFNNGLRNPWRWSFDPLTFDTVIGDVGDGGGASEKLFFASQATGDKRNWGWAPGVLDARKPDGTIATLASDGGAIIGGRVYRGTNPKMAGACGRIFYGHLSGKVYTIKTDGSENHQEQSLSGVQDLASFAVDAKGELYTLHLGGEIFRIDAQ